MSGIINVTNNTIKDLGEPESNGDAATKKYIDDKNKLSMMNSLTIISS